MSRAVKLVLALVVIVAIAIGAFVFWYFVLDDDAPPEAELRDRSAETTTSASGETGTGDTGASAASADGSWTVETGDEVFVGYRVQELFAGDTLKKDAVGRSPAVDGTITVSGTSVTEGTFTADLTQLTSDQSRRDNAIRGRGLETDQFPEATFTLTAPIDIGAEPAVGTAYTLTARGDLTLHGVTRPIEFEIDARWNGETIDVAGNVPIVLADYGIEPPDVAGTLEVDDNGAMEFQLTFVPGASA